MNKHYGLCELRELFLSVDLFYRTNIKGHWHGPTMLMGIYMRPNFQDLCAWSPCLHGCLNRTKCPLIVFRYHDTVIPFLNFYLFREVLTQSHSPRYRANHLTSSCPSSQLDLAQWPTLGKSISKPTGSPSQYTMHQKKPKFVST